MTADHKTKIISKRKRGPHEHPIYDAKLDQGDKVMFFAGMRYEEITEKKTTPRIETASPAGDLLNIFSQWLGEDFGDAQGVHVTMTADKLVFKKTGEKIQWSDKAERTVDATSWIGLKGKGRRKD